MSKSRKRKIKRKSGARRHRGATFLTSLGPATQTRPEVGSWPVVRAYVPIEDAWRATGCGSAAVIRERPDGRWATGFFTMSLLDDGLMGMFGKDDDTPEKCESWLKQIRPMIPPMEEGPIELAAEYIWGAYALGQKKGLMWPPQTNQFLSLVPKPPGTGKDWLRRLVGPDGLTPPGLVKVIRENPVPEDIPEGKEIAIFTEMTFALESAEMVIEQLHERDPDFVHTGYEGEVEIFDWTREYPKNHWSPLKTLGGRQILGSVRVGPAQLIAEAKTLSMAARLVGILKEMFGEQIRLKETTWQSLSDLLASHRISGDV